MPEIMKLDSMPKLLSILTGIVSLMLFAYGTFSETYWAGFGLILLAPALIMFVVAPRS